MIKRCKRIFFEQARQEIKRGLIIIEPRTDTGAGVEDEWIPIRPCTDAYAGHRSAYV